MSQRVSTDATERPQPETVVFVGGPLDGKRYPFSDVGYRPRYDVKGGYYHWDYESFQHVLSGGSKTAKMRYKRYLFMREEDDGR